MSVRAGSNTDLDVRNIPSRFEKSVAVMKTSAFQNASAELAMRS